MSKLTTRALRSYLQAQPHEVLVEEIVALASRVDALREYYSIQLGTGALDDLLDKHKATIKKEFFPTRGIGHARLSIARKAVTDYKKIAGSPASVIDLMLYYVEMGVGYTNSYGDISEAFYNSMESMYAQALKLMAQTKLHDQFERRCKQVVDDTRNIGWSFHDGLSQMYSEAFEQQSEEA